MFSLGIDIGYSSIKFVLINKNLEVIERSYILHKGRVKEEISKYVSYLENKYGEGITKGGATGQGSKFLSDKKGISWINEVTSLVEGSKHCREDIKSVIEIGGQSSKYITNVDDNGNNSIKISINSNCSAGTGSFLEEQVSRLGIRLEDYSKLTEKASYIPRIAGRCSVFAKTDIIHHQQEGTETKEILLGLAYALVKNYRANVVKKNPIQPPILLTGGVAYNDAIVKALKDVMKLRSEEMITPDNCGIVAALGAAVIGLKEGLLLDLSDIKRIITEKDQSQNLIQDAVSFPTLEQFGSHDSINKHECKDISSQSYVKGYIGIDVGSTSTNVILMDEDYAVLDFRYLRTLGDPIAAVSKGLLEIEKHMVENNKELEILGVGATGSGRYMAGSYIGADVIIDEITAQAKAASTIDKDVDTIIEIGGQDSKFIKLEKGIVSDFEMNKICAAGTGSFIEEQAKKLNISLDDFGNLALSSNNPIDLGDRCTVFIETNIAASISNEGKIEDIAAGLSYSIVKNYLNKVVGKKEVGKKIFFQGGVAYNQAVVNAFRGILGDKLEVPKFFSVTGAFGAAILAKEEMKTSASAFKGFNLDQDFNFKEIEKKETIETTKRSKIFEEIEGYYLKGYEGAIDPAKKTIGIPRVLFLHKLFPLFNTYFKELGFNVLLSENSSEKTVALSQEFTMDETCYPIKLINGHVAELIAKKVDYLFLPSLYTMAHPVSTTRQNYGCVYMQCVPKLVNKTMDLEKKGIRILSPELSFKFGKQYMMKTLMTLGKQLGKNSIQTTVAWAKGMKRLKDFELEVEKLGENTIKGLGKDEKAFVIVTRGYGIVDPILNMGIPEKLEKLGYKVLTLSNLPAHDHDTSKEYPNMYWPFGQHILSGAQIIKEHPNLYPIYITNHGCGPDTVLSHYFKEEMKGKPYLNIEVDEHFSSVGVLTRVEAFVNSLKSEKIKEEESLSLKEYSDQVNHRVTSVKSKLKEIDKTTEVYLPYLFPYSNLLATYLQEKGYRAQVLPMTTKKTLDIGRKYTLSKEYLSFTCLVGDVLNQALELKASGKNYGFLIPTSEGSEVGGQYHRLIRDKLNGANMENVEIVAPFIEDLIKDSTLAEDLFLILLGGDLINLAPRNERVKYLNNLNGLIAEGKLTIEHLEEVTRKIHNSMDKRNKSHKIYLLGEVGLLFNDFMNNHTIKKMEEQGIQLLFAPLSEYMWFFWRDFITQSGNKKDILGHNQLTKLSNYIKRSSNLLVSNNPFEEDLEMLIKRADQNLHLYAGGNGRYRYAKALGDFESVDGVITVSSMYENTNTILNILTQEENKSSKIPVLNMSFDGNENEIDKSKIESFIYYTLKASKNAVEDCERRAENEA